MHGGASIVVRRGSDYRSLDFRGIKLLTSSIFAPLIPNTPWDNMRFAICRIDGGSILVPQELSTVAAPTLRVIR